MFAKHARWPPLSALAMLACLGWRWAFMGPIVDFGARPPRMMRLKAFFKGAAAGARVRINRSNGRFSDE
jgi:hypothetical protein